MSADAITPLRRRMLEDMNARKLNPHTQRSHISSCKRFAAYLKRSPDTATADDIRLFQLHLVELGASIPNRNRIMTGVRFLFRVTLRRLDLAAEIYHIKEPQKIPLVLSPDETRRLLAMSENLKVRVLLALSYGAGLRAGEVVRLKAGDIDSAQHVIRVLQAKGRKDRHVMLSPETLALLRQWWKVRPTRYDGGVPQEQRLLFPGGKPGKPMTTRHHLVLLADAGLVGKPNLYVACRDAGFQRAISLQARAEAFLKSSIAPCGAAHSDAGARKACDSPSCAARGSRVVSESADAEGLRNSHWQRSTMRQRTTPWIAGVGHFLDDAKQSGALRHR